MPDHQHRIETVTLDDASIIRRTPEVEHERRVAMVDLTHSNAVELHEGSVTSPYGLFISVRDNRLTLRFTGSNAATHDVTIPLSPFRGIIKDYFLMCESYYEAIKHAPPDRIQTVDMARRSVHNEGSEMLQEMVKDSLTMDFNTARRLFTLICVLHIK
jgi:uncharacterized protein (UPF0262 family)